MQSTPRSRQRGGIGRTIAIGLGAIAILTVVAFAGLYYVGTQTDAEELAAMAAEDDNRLKGQITGGVIRNDGSLADGPTVTAYRTILDSWPEHVGEWDVRPESIEAVASVAAKGTSAALCDTVAAFADDRLTMVYVIRDERGRVLEEVSASVKTC